MKRLYDLNKDELIQILCKVIKNLSEEELEAELKKRRADIMLLLPAIWNLTRLNNLWNQQLNVLKDTGFLKMQVIPGMRF